MTKGYYIAFTGIGVTLVIGLIFLLTESTRQGQSAPPPTANLPALLQAVSDAQAAYQKADNDLRRSGIRKDRDDAVSAAVPNGDFIEWPGTLMSMWTDSKGNASIKIGLKDCRCGLVTGEEDEDKILIGSDLFNRLAQMKAGDHVIVSGKMSAESSITEAGSVDDPEWYTVFTDVAADPTPYPAKPLDQ